MLFVFMLYVVSLLLMTGLSEVVLLLFMMESLSWFFIFFLTSSLVLKYLLIQTVFFLLGMASVLWSSKVLVLLFLVKLGLPPFHLWFMSFSAWLNKKAFLFMTTVHKVAPIFIMGKLMMETSLLLIVFSFIMSGQVMMEVSDFFYVMMISSMIHSGWILMSSWVSLKIMGVYFFIYTLLLGLFFFGLGSKSLKLALMEQNSNSSLLWLVFSGFPPFSLFWLKVLIISFIVYVIFMHSVVLMFVSVISLLVYYRVFHLSMVPSFFNKIKYSFFIPFMCFLGFF